jgi:hypothetical protein
LEETAEQLYGLNLAVGNDGVIKMHWPISFPQARYVRRSESPIAGWASRHDVQMKVRDLLPTADTVVLIQEDAVGRVCGNQSSGDTPGRRHHGRFLGLSQIEHGWGMPNRKNHALSDLKLAPVKNGDRQIGAFDDVPARGQALDDSAQVA